MNEMIIASGPVIVEDEKVLLNKHGDTNFWKFCGGRVENFEIGLAENAKLKVKEEMGLDIKIEDKKPFLLYTKKETPGATIDVILVHFLAKRVNEVNPEKDIKEWSWIPLEKLNNEELAPNIIPTLKYFKFL